MKNHTISFSNVLGGNAHRPRMIWSFIGAFLTAAILLTVFLVGCGNWDEGSIIGPTDALLPTVSATEPMNHATNVPINKKIALTFSEEMDPLTITKTTFTLKQGTTLVQITVNYVGLVATMTPSADLAANTTYTATISTEAEDLAGNELANEYKWIFTTGSSSDNTPPTLSSVEPATNATNVPINKKIAATFSEAMDPSTITKTTVTLKRGTKPVSGTVSYVGLVMTFTPADKFATNTEYTVTISTGVMDLAGNAMSNNFVWSFITGTTLDITPPTVLSTEPLDDATGVDLNKKIIAIFSKAMNPLTINTATVLVTDVTGVVNYDKMTKTVTFTPSENLASGTIYTVTVSNDVEDLAGNKMLNDFTWNFSTVTSTGPAPVPLGTAGRFVILSNSAITNIATSSITGDVGISPGARIDITGLLDGDGQVVAGYAIYASSDGATVADMLTTAKADAERAYQFAITTAGTPTPISGNINGLTLIPGLYESGTSIEISSGGFLYLDAQGDENAVFIIRSANTITTESTSEVVLTGSAKAKNIYWVAGSAITLGTDSRMKGTLIASTSISLLSHARLDGRALIQSASAGQVSLDQNIIVKP